MSWLRPGINEEKKTTKSSWLTPANVTVPKVKNPLQAVETEIKNKQGVLQRYGIPDPANQDDRNWLERTLNTPENTGFLGDVLDVLSRGQYASANIAKSLADDKKDSFGDVLKAGARGLTGQDRTSYSDVLAETGMKPGALRSTLGFIGDVALDPTTYLTLGTGVASKAGGKATAKGLGKLVPKALGKEAVDRGGVKFAGLSLIPQTTINKAADAIKLPQLANAVRDTKPAQVLGKAFIPNFREIGTNKEIWDSFIDLKKGYQNSLSYAQRKAVDDAIKLGNGLTPEQRALASHALQNPSIYAKAPQKVKNAADAARNALDASASVEQGLGLLGELKPNYLPGIYPEKGKALLEGIRYNPSIRATLGKHAKQKKFDTLQEAIDAGLKPETDIAKLVGIREVASARAVETQKFINDVLDKFGQKVSVKDIDKLPEDVGVYLPKGSFKFFPQGTVPKSVLDLVEGMSSDELIELPAKVIKNGIGISKDVLVYALPRQIAKELNTFKKAAWDEGTKGLIKYGYDVPLNLWKGYATAANPGFHIRNALSNAFQTYLNNASSLLNPATHAKAFGTLFADKNTPFISKWAKKQTVDIGGKKFSLPEVKELMKKEGVLNQGWFDKEIGEQIGEGLKDVGSKVSDRLKPKALLGQTLNPLSTSNALLKTGRTVGSGVENQARAFNFLTNLKQTGDAKKAAELTDKFLFDYGDLTDFEKNVAKRVVPFYTWLRKNIPLQVEQLAKQPGKYAAIPKAINAVEQNSPQVDEKYLPDYMKNWVRTPFTQAGNQVYWNPNQPYGDLDKLNPAELKKTALSAISPMLKVPIELGTNQNFFFKDKIERYPGEMKKAPGYIPEGTPDAIKSLLGVQRGKGKDEQPELQMPAKTRYLLSQIPFAENVSRTMDYEGNQKLNQLLSFLLGAKIAPYDIEKAQTNYKYDYRDELRALIDKLQAQGVLPQDLTYTEPKKKENKWLK